MVGGDGRGKVMRVWTKNFYFPIPIALKSYGVSDRLECIVLRNRIADIGTRPSDFVATLFFLLSGYFYMTVQRKPSLFPIIARISERLNLTLETSYF